MSKEDNMRDGFQVSKKLAESIYALINQIKEKDKQNITKEESDFINSYESYLKLAVADSLKNKEESASKDTTNIRCSKIKRENIILLNAINEIINLSPLNSRLVDAQYQAIVAKEEIETLIE